MVSDAEHAAAGTSSLRARRVLDDGIAALRPELQATEARIRADAGRRRNDSSVVKPRLVRAFRNLRARWPDHVVDVGEHDQEVHVSLAGRNGVIQISDDPFGGSARVPDPGVALTQRVDARELIDEDAATKVVERFLRDLRDAG